MKLNILLISATFVTGVVYAATTDKPLSLADEHALLKKQDADIHTVATAFCTALRRERIDGLPDR